MTTLLVQYMTNCNNTFSNIFCVPFSGHMNFIPEIVLSEGVTCHSTIMVSTITGFQIFLWSTKDSNDECVISCLPVPGTKLCYISLGKIT